MSKHRKVREFTGYWSFYAPSGERFCCQMEGDYNYDFSWMIRRPNTLYGYVKSFRTFKQAWKWFIHNIEPTGEKTFRDVEIPAVAPVMSRQIELVDNVSNQSERTRWHTWVHELAHAAVVMYASGEENKLRSILVRERGKGGHVTHATTTIEAVVSVAGAVGDYLSGGLVPLENRRSIRACNASGDRNSFVRVLKYYVPRNSAPEFIYDVLDELAFDPESVDFYLLSGSRNWTKGIRDKSAAAVYEAWLIVTGVWDAIVITANELVKDEVKRIDSRNFNRLAVLKAAVDAHKGIYKKGE